MADKQTGMMLDTRKENKEGFNPNVANDERTPNVTTASKVGYIFI
jgi:hypothetical protein